MISIKFLTRLTLDLILTSDDLSEVTEGQVGVMRYHSESKFNADRNGAFLDPGGHFYL